MCLVEFVLAEDPMEDAVAVVLMQNALQQVHEGRDDGDMRGEEQLPVGQDCAETTHDEEEELD